MAFSPFFVMHYARMQECKNARMQECKIDGGLFHTRNVFARTGINANHFTDLYE